MADDFGSHQPGLQAPATKAASITPHDTNELDPTPRGIYVGTSGNLKVNLVDDQPENFVTFVGVVAGNIYPIRANIVHTDTTADDLIAIS